MLSPHGACSVEHIVRAVGLNRQLAEILSDPSMADRLRADPRTEFERYGLSAQQVAWLLAGAVGDLYRHGANPLLASCLGAQRLFGLDDALYSERLRGAGSARVAPASVIARG